METVELKVEGMDCEGCVKSVTRMLSGLPGVQNADVSLAQASARVTYDPAKVDVGQMKKAEALLKQSFAIPSNLLVQVVNKREWPEFLLARGRYEEAMIAAQTLTSHPHPVVQASGQIEAGFVFLATKRFAEAANASNAALRLMRAAPDGQAIASIQLEQLQGEFNLRTAQRDKGRQGMERAAQKMRALPGPDNWSQ